MKVFFTIMFLGVLYSSCKKEEQTNIDAKITYTHWAQTKSNSLDTLFSVYIPNAFTPNSDGINEYFAPTGYFTGNKFEFKVYGRGGNEIYSTINKYVYGGWDGKQAGVNVPEGNYAYQLKLNDVAGQEYVFNGLVAVIR